MPDSRSQDGRLVLNGSRLKQLRQQHGLSQEALAQHCFDRRLCVSIASIKRAERGKPVLYRTARHLAEMFAVDVSQLSLNDPAPNTSDTRLIEEEADKDDPRRVLRLRIPSSTVNDTYRQLIDQHGGTQLYSDNGEHIAIFGYPRAYRSDALRCIQCAQALQQQHPAPLVIGEWLYPLPMDGSSIAPALTDLEAGIWLERGVGIQLAEHIITQSHSASGLLEYQGQRTDAGSLHPLIGRHVEISQLKSLIDTTHRYQTAHLIYVRGVAGIGKTRLSQEVTDMAKQLGHVTHQASALDFGSHSDDGPLAQLTLSLLSLTPDTRDNAVISGPVETALERLKLPRDHALVLCPLLALPQSDSDQALYAAMSHDVRNERLNHALCDLLQRLAIAAPQLIIIEDLHWADEDLFQTLTPLLQCSQEVPVIWLLTSRLEQDPLDSRLRPGITDLPLSVIDLAPLRQVDAQALTEHYQHVSSQFAQQCITRAQGNPLFLTQLLLFVPSQALPSSLRNLVQSKLDQLPVLERKAMHIAAAIGQHFPLEAIRQLLSSSRYMPSQAIDLRLIRPTSSGHYQFIHDLILQGIYESISAESRVGLHLALADYYLSRDDTLHAQHLHKARSPDTPAAFLKAIEHQLQRYQHGTALTLIRQCRSIDYAPLEIDRLDLMHAEVCLATGLTLEAQRYFQSSIRHTGSDTTHLRALLGVARTLNMLDHLEEESRTLDLIAELAETQSAHWALSEMHYLRGNLYFPQGDFAASRHHHNQALREARIARHWRYEIQALSGLGDSYYAEGDMPRTRDAFQHCVQLCRDHEQRDLEAANLFMLATARIYFNETQQALGDSEEAAELGKRAGNRRAEVVARLTASWVLLSLDRIDAAHQHINIAMTLAQGMGANRFEAFLLETQARLWLVQDEDDKARDAIRRSCKLVEQHAMHAFIGPWVTGTLALLESDSDSRQKAIERGQQWMEQGCVGHNTYRFLVSASEASLLDGRIDQARQMIQQLVRFCHDKPCPWTTHHAELLLSLADWQQHPSAGKLQHARDIWQRGSKAGLVMTLPQAVRAWLS